MKPAGRGCPYQCQARTYIKVQNAFLFMAPL